MDTLQFLVKVLHENMGNVTDENIIRENIFNVIVAFDEIITLGYRENVNSASLQTYLEMESHEEMVQEIIARVYILQMPACINFPFRTKCRRPERRPSLR